MKRTALVLIGTIFLCICIPKTEAVIFNDGGYHIVDYSTDTITVDYETPGAGTNVEIQEGAVAAWVKAYEDSIVNVEGGIFSSTSKAYGRSQLNISGGTFTGLTSHDDSIVNITDCEISNLYQVLDNGYVNISGGTFNSGVFLQLNSEGILSGGYFEHLTVADYSQTTIRGGIFGEQITSGSLWDKGFGHHSLITIEGTDFAIDGVAVNYGDSAIDYATLTQWNGSWNYQGTLTGVLANGDIINTTFHIIDESDIIFAVPEPTTMIFLSLGSLMLRKKRG